MSMQESGLNWLIEGTNDSKLSLNYQSQPIFEAQTDGTKRNTIRKGMVQLQEQLLFSQNLKLSLTFRQYNAEFFVLLINLI
jgi:hypothetical protein